MRADVQSRFFILKADADIDPARGEKVLDLDEGLVFLLNEKFRHKPYYHGVSRVEASRISVTFRTVQWR